MIFKNKKSKFRCGILGCGNIAGSYDSPKSNKVRTHAKAFLKNKNCSLISVCDNSLIKAKDFANTWGASFYYDNIDEFLKDNLDIISICTPTETHRVIFEKVVIHLYSNYLILSQCGWETLVTGIGCGVSLGSVCTIDCITMLLVYMTIVSILMSPDERIRCHL